MLFCSILIFKDSISVIIFNKYFHVCAVNVPTEWRARKFSFSCLLQKSVPQVSGIFLPHLRCSAACCQANPRGRRQQTAYIFKHQSPTETLSTKWIRNSRGKYLCSGVQINLFWVTPATPSWDNKAFPSPPCFLTPQKGGKAHWNETNF